MSLVFDIMLLFLTTVVWPIGVACDKTDSIFSSGAIPCLCVISYKATMAKKKKNIYDIVYPSISRTLL